jgi:hypothetical protein
MKVLWMPDYYFFKKAGIYKIRVGFRASRLNKGYKDITSEWVSIFVKTIKVEKVKKVVKFE